MNTNAIRNDGTWEPVISWLDGMSHRGLFRIPFGTHPPVSRRPDGVLEIRDVHTGAVIGECPIGDWVVLGPDGFTAESFTEPAWDEYPAAPDAH